MAKVIGFPKRELPTEQPLRTRFANELVEAGSVEWVVPDLIPRGTVSLLAGAPFLGKTMLCQQLMLCCGLQKPWFGFNVMGCRSYAVFSEDPDERVLIPRRNRILEHIGADFRDLDESVSWSSPSDQFPVFDPTLFACRKFKPGGKATELWHMIMQHCLDIGVTLLILDNASTVLDGEEPAHVLAFCRFLFEQAIRTQLAILLLHHPPKDGSSIASGTGKWTTAIRHILVLERHPRRKDEDEYDYQRNDDGRRVLRLHNSNWTNERPRLYIRWENGVLVEDEPPAEVRKIWRLSLSEQRDLDQRVWQALRYCQERGWPVASDPISRTSLYNRSGSNGWMRTFGREQIDAAIDRLVNAGQIIRDGKEIRTPS
jgi:RecA-family ATPase